MIFQTTPFWGNPYPLIFQGVNPFGSQTCAPVEKVHPPTGDFLDVFGGAEAAQRADMEAP